MKIIGILLFLFGGFLFLAGAGGAVYNFFIMPNHYLCQKADRELAEVKTLGQKADAAKGTPLEQEARQEYEKKASLLKITVDGCGEMEDQERMYGIALVAAGVVGFLILVLGAVLAFIGFRRKKALA